MTSKALNRPEVIRSGVLRTLAATRRRRSQGSSLRSRTHFLKKTLDISSMASKPARSIRSAMGRIIPVRMRVAHRLNWPSRKVVSTKRISLMGVVRPNFERLSFAFHRHVRRNLPEFLRTDPANLQQNVRLFRRTRHLP